MTALAAIIETRKHRFLRDATRAQSLPQVSTSKDVSDAHLIQLARHHELKIATFDAALSREAMGGRRGRGSYASDAIIVDSMKSRAPVPSSGARCRPLRTPRRPA